MAKTTAKRKGKAPARVKSAARKSSPAKRPVKAKAKTTTKSRAKKPAKQVFVASHLNESDFAEGLRSYAKYRDLGIAAATQGLARAHVIRLIPPCIPAEVSKRHYHDVDFQMIYVLKGWMKGEYEGAGVVTMREGSCWLQPPNIKHTVLDYSDDCELLEIILPADFDTVEL
jgi:hypothetical protein